MAAEGRHQVGVVGAGDVHTVMDAGLGGYPLGVKLQVQILHRGILAIVENYYQDGQVFRGRYAETLNDGVVQEGAIAHQRYHWGVGLGQFDAEGRAQSLAQSAIGVEVALGSVPGDVPQDGAPVGDGFLNVGGVVGHHLADSGAQPYWVDGAFRSGGLDGGAVTFSRLVVLGLPLGLSC